MCSSDWRAHAIPLFVRSSVLPLNMLYFKYSVILMHDISNNRAPSKICELFVRSNMIHSYYTRFSAAGNFYVQRSRLNQLLLSFSRSGVSSAKTLSSVNYINYWSRFWRLRRCMLIWVPLPVSTWTTYSVKVFSFLITIGATFYLFMYLFIDWLQFIFAFSLLSFFSRLYRRQLLYCCPTRIANCG